MEKEFPPYELALELKELGFDEPCLAFYDGKGDSNIYFNNKRDASGDYIPFIKHERLTWFGAPTYSQAFRFFREKYDIHYSINRECSQHDHKWGYNWSLYNYTGIFDEFITSHPDAPAGEWVYETYEEAERECLKEIIKIINEKD
jgi:hypothetical protein